MKKTDLRYVEKPDQRRAQLWMGYNVENEHSFTDRHRILYPDGRTEWSYYGDLSDTHLNGDGYWCRHACWQGPIKIRSFKKRIKLMRGYDKMQSRTTIFLGNI